jgi:tellurite resistance protein
MAENDIETDDVDLGYESLMESISDFSANLAANLEQYELIEVDESYAEEVVSVLGNSAALQNLCIGIALAVSAGDGEISELESEAINLLASKMDLFIGDIATMIAESVLEAVAESK